MTYCLYRRLDWIFQKKIVLPAMCEWKKNIKLIFLTLLIIYFLIFTFSFPLRQLLLSDYTLMLSSQTEWYYFYKKHISFTNGIFDMQTSLAIPFTILKTMNHAYLIFNTAITWPLNIHVASVLRMLQKIMLSVVISVTYGYI